MSWGRGWRGPWPGNGPFSYLPPWQRPGWVFGRGSCWLYGNPWMYYYNRPYYWPSYYRPSYYWWSNPYYMAPSYYGLPYYPFPYYW